MAEKCIYKYVPTHVNKRETVGTVFTDTFTSTLLEIQTFGKFV